MSLVKIAALLLHSLEFLRFSGPVTHVYNPLEYAHVPFNKYLKRYGMGEREVLMVGMNPGPYGMTQTGVPFGAVPMVRDWLHIDGPVGRPALEHPKRPIEGFACKRIEVSGQRLWGWAQCTFGTADNFFERFFVYNYCPLAFMEESGKNRTPDKLPARERELLYAACDTALQGVVSELRPRLVVGVGAFATQRARQALQPFTVPVGQILHPSPASPLANRGWASQASEALRALGVHGLS